MLEEVNAEASLRNAPSGALLQHVGTVGGFVFLPAEARAAGAFFGGATAAGMLFGGEAASDLLR